MSRFFNAGLNRSLLAVLEFGKVLADLADAFLDEVLAGLEEACVALAVEQQQIAHNDVAEHLGEGAGAVFEAFTGGAFGCSELIELVV